jgi:hypothetical protein
MFAVLEKRVAMSRRVALLATAMVASVLPCLALVVAIYLYNGGKCL